VSLAIGARSGADGYGTAVLLGLLLVMVVLASWLGRLPRTAPLLRWAAWAAIAFMALLCIVTTEGPPAWREDALIAGILTTLAVAVALLGTGREASALAGTGLTGVAVAFAGASLGLLLRGYVVPSLAMFGVSLATCVAAFASISGRLDKSPSILTLLLPVAGLLLGAAFPGQHHAMTGLTLSGLSLGTLILLATFRSGRADLETVAITGFSVAWLAFGIGRAADRQLLAGGSDCLGSLALAVCIAARARGWLAVLGSAELVMGLSFAAMGIDFARNREFVLATVFISCALAATAQAISTFHGQPWARRLRAFAKASTKAQP
jgi:hypothetical protein